jgi:hypothetical protein
MAEKYGNFFIQHPLLFLCEGEERPHRLGGSLVTALQAAILGYSVGNKSEASTLCHA